MKNERNACELYWVVYKYQTLSHSGKIYQDIREYLKGDCPSLNHVRTLVEEALSFPEHRGQVLTAYQHIWGYFKKKASQAEKEHFMSLLDQYQHNKIEQETLTEAVKNLLCTYPTYLAASSFIVGGKQ